MGSVLFFVSSMQGGGAERVAALLSNYWVETGNEVTVVATYSKRGTCAYALSKKVRLIYLADRVGTTRKTPLTTIRRLLEMRKLAKEIKPTTILSFLTNVNIGVIFATVGLGIRIVISERIYPPASPIHRVLQFLRYLMYPLADQVVMQTQDGLRWLKRTIPESSGIVISNPCIFPLPKYQPFLLPNHVFCPKQNLLLAVGRLIERKQFDLLIDAFVTLAPQFPSWNLAIIGNGPERQALTTQVIAANLTDRIHLAGHAGNIGDWYSRADLYVMTSKFEGFPNSLLEALAYGLPAVSFDCATGPSEMIDDGLNGYLVPSSTGAIGLAKHLALLMANNSLREAFSVRAVKVRDRFSLDRVGADWDIALRLRRKNISG